MKTTRETTRTIFVQLQKETLEQLERVPKGTISEQSQEIGLRNGEPLIVAMDGLLRYAKAVKQRWGNTISEDGVLGGDWLAAAKGIRGLLNGNGAVALEKDREYR